MTKPHSYDRRAVFSWCMYDFANSAFTTLVVTFIYATYFTEVIAPNKILGTQYWSWGVAATAILVALLSPILGAIADRSGYRKRLLFITTAISIGGSVALFTPLPGEVKKALIWFIVANVAFELGGVFYNAYLPGIVPRERIGRISGYGWSLGYVGGLLAMAIALLVLIRPEVPWFGFSRELGENVRATNLLVAVWFALFSIPIFLWVHEDRPRSARGKGSMLADSVGQLVATFREIRRYRQIARLLLARLVYNDGLVTIFAFGAIYASGTFGFTTMDILIFGIVLNVAAGLGAFAFGFLDDLVGGKKTIQISLIGLTLAGVIAVLAPSRAFFWVAAILVGLMSGPNQAASRSLMGRFVPQQKQSEFFGFFAFSGKATAFLGPLLLGYLTALFESQRAGVAIVIPFFVLGSLLLTRVNEQEGVKSADQEG